MPHCPAAPASLAPCPALRRGMLVPAGLCPLLPGENDIDQLGRTLALLGPIEPQWPAVVALPDYGKVTFVHQQPTPLDKVLPAASHQALSLLQGMLKCVGLGAFLLGHAADSWPAVPGMTPMSALLSLPPFSTASS